LRLELSQLQLLRSTHTRRVVGPRCYSLLVNLDGGPPDSGWDRVNKKNKGPRLSSHFSRK
jgi:hypothetical protein